ncbi:MAG: hypothetical protein SW833_13250 [Cyanobacteriota bacterium]|nr:hypothetical protein [Cyanobacteriota bacterium]
MQEIKGEDYNVKYDPDSTTFYFQGELSLGGPSEYAPIAELLNTTLQEEPSVITLNLEKLEFLNSSGISLLSKFVINARKKKTTHIMVKGSKGIPWQEKSLKNLTKLLPSLQLEID